MKIIPLKVADALLEASGINSISMSESSFMPTECFALPNVTGVILQSEISFLRIFTALTFVSVSSHKKASSASSEISASFSVAFLQKSSSP